MDCGLWILDWTLDSRLDCVDAECEIKCRNVYKQLRVAIRVSLHYVLLTHLLSLCNTGESLSVKDFCRIT